MTNALLQVLRARVSRSVRRRGSLVSVDMREICAWSQLTAVPKSRKQPAASMLGERTPRTVLRVVRRRLVKNRLTTHHITPERRSLDTSQQTDDSDAVLMRIALV